MRDHDYSVSVDFLTRLFGETSQNIELRACPNDRGGAAVPLFSRDEAEWAAFCQKRDGDGTGVYFGVCTRRDGATSGSQMNVVECPALWVDIDCVKQGISGETAQQALGYLPCPPTMIINSGGGLHAYWVLEEAVDVSPESPAREQVTQTLRMLAMVLAGDMACAEVARILRLPGTHNTKAATKALYDGQAALCEVLSDTGAVYDLDQLTEWLGEQRAVLHGKAAEARPVQESDPFVAYARSTGYEPAIDIDVALAAMQHGSSGTNSIHQTQLRVSMSMLSRGYDEDEIVARILAATEAAAPTDERWNWGREEDSIRKMVQSGKPKVEERKETPRPTPAPSSGSAAVAVVHDLAEERAKREEKAPKAKQKAEDKQAAMIIVAGSVLSVWQEKFGPLMHFDGGTYAYSAGVWALWTPQHEQRIRMMIQEACASLNITPNNSTLNGAYRYIMERPELEGCGVEWDKHGLIIADDGTVDPATGALGEHSPSHYALFKVAASAQGVRDCTAWLGFLAGTFQDKTPEEATAIVLTLQEWFGASLVAHKPRSMKLGLLAHGPSRTGKTQIAKVMRGLLGVRHVANPRMRDLEGRFGMEPFLGKRGWIADDAIGEGEYLDADTYKVVVTGEETSVQCKGGRNVETAFGFPVMLTANNLPRVKDQSDAVYNRSLILPCTHVRPETEPEPVGYDSIAEKVIAEELSGIFWWAFEGWQRLRARGYYAPPKTMVDAKKGFEADNNPVGSWMEECLELDPDTKVSRNDLLASMNGWNSQEYGVDAKPWNGRGFFPRLFKMVPGYSKQSEKTTDKGVRLLIGVRLNGAGLTAWRTFKDSRWADGSKTAESEEFVNQKHYTAAPETAAVDRKPRF